MLEKYKKHGKTAWDEAAAKKAKNLAEDKKRRERREKEEKELREQREQSPQIMEVTEEEAKRIEAEEKSKKPPPPDMPPPTLAYEVEAVAGDMGGAQRSGQTHMGSTKRDVGGRQGTLWVMPPWA